MKLILKGENILNVPNVISLYRLLMCPVILVLALKDLQNWFIIFVCINLVSDILDGFIARHFKLVTRFGGGLDNLADLCTYFVIIYGIYRYKWPDFQPHQLSLFIFLSIFILSYLVAFTRFGKIPGLHLYSAVLAGYIQGAFSVVLFIWGFNLWFYYIAVGWGIVAYTEKIFVLFNLDDIKPGVKGLYWLLKAKSQNKE
jgi:cardiolipin synthase (CMP-forming)